MTSSEPGTDEADLTQLPHAAAYAQGPARKLKADENDIFSGMILTTFVIVIAELTFYFRWGGCSRYTRSQERARAVRLQPRTAQVDRQVMHNWISSLS